MIRAGCFHRFFYVLMMLGFPLCAGAGTVTNSHAQLWSQQQGNLVTEFGLVNPDMIDQLRSELWLLVPESRQPGSAMVALSPLELISVRGKYPDLSSLAGIKMARIQRITLGGAPEFVEVGHKYVLFFEGVARGSWGLVLRQRLRRADEALKELSRKTLARKAYLDEFEKTLGGDHQNGLKAVDPAVIPGLEKSRIESYLDEAEKRFDKP